MINAILDRAREPYREAKYLVKLFGRVVYSGTKEQCANFCKDRKVTLVVIPESGAYAWRELD
jgi:hypothetical protein